MIIPIDKEFRLLQNILVDSSNNLLTPEQGSNPELTVNSIPQDMTLSPDLLQTSEGTPTAQPEKNSGKTLFFITLALIVLLMAMLGGAIYYINLLGVRYEKSQLLLKSLGETRDSLEQIDSSVSDLHDLVRLSATIEAQSNNQSKSGLTTHSFYEEVVRLSQVPQVTNTKTSKTVFKSQKAPPVMLEMESKTIDRLRDAHEKSLAGFKNSELAGESIKKIEGEVKDTGDKTVLTSLSGIENTFLDSKKYISESGKVMNYYAIQTDVQLKLLPETVSLMNLYANVGVAEEPTTYSSQLREIKSTFKELKKNLTDMDPSMVPSGLEKLHEDMIKLFDYLDTFIVNLQLSIDRFDTPLYFKSYAQLTSDLLPLSARSITYERSFWQNTDIVSTFEELDSQYKKIADSLQKVSDDSRTPFTK